MQEKKKKANKHKIKKNKLLNSFLIIWHFLIFINIVLHTKGLRQNNPVEFIVTYTPTVTSTGPLLLVFHFACKACILNFFPLIGFIVSPN